MRLGRRAPRSRWTNTIALAVTVPTKAEEREEATAAFAGVVAAMRQEAACISYGFYADIAYPCSVLAYEELASEEALDLHKKTQHMATFGGASAVLGAGPNAVTKHVVP